MAISVTCTCGKQFKVKDELAGKRGKCAACGQVLSIPAIPSSAALEKAIPAPLRACPACWEALQPNAVICLHCGHDLRTGKQVPQAKSAAPSRPSAEAPVASARLWIALIAGGICLAGVVAAVALLSWGRGPGISAVAPKTNPKGSIDLSFEEAFREGRIAWQGVKNTQLTTKTAGQQMMESSEFTQKFKYDENGKRSIDTTGYKTYTWPDREATFGPGAVIRLTQNSNVREGAIRAGEEWTWTGQQWTAKPTKEGLNSKVTTEQTDNPPKGTGAAVAASDAAKAWAKRMLVVTNPRDNLSKRLESTKGDRRFGDAIEAWRKALEEKGGDNVSFLNFLSFFTQLNAVFEDHVFQPDRSDKYVQRIQSLSADAITAWQELINQVAETEFNKNAAIISLIQFDRLFRVAEFNSAEFDLLKARARALPADSIKTLAETLGEGAKREQAFTNLLDQDWLYRPDGSFNQDIFREALGYLTAQQKEAKQ